MADTTVLSAEGIGLVVHDFGGEGPPALLVHATSFHGRVFAPLAARLGSFWHCYANDVRGHGSSSAPPDAELSWEALADDVLRIVSDLGLHQPLGIGHSSGASALLLAEVRRPGSFSSLYCYEPIVVNEEVRSKGPALTYPERARKRRSRFSTRAEALSQYQQRSAFSHFDPQVLQAYVEYGFQPNDGAVELSCAPQFEARFYEQCYASDVLSPGQVINCPVTIAVGELSQDIGRACVPVLQHLLPQARLVELAGLGHLGPLENPELVAGSIIHENERPTT